MDNEEYFKKLNKKAEEKPSPEVKVIQPQDRKIYRPYSYATFTGMTGWVAWVVFFYFIFWFTYVLVASTSNVTVEYFFSFGLAIGMCLFVVLIILIFYIRFGGWVERLPFPLEGWTELVAAHRMNKQKYYRLVTVEVIIKPVTATDIKNSVTNALKILNNAQNRWIKKDSFNDGRQQWKMMNELSTTGTANNRAMGRIKKSLEKELSEIQQRTNCIEKVVISFEKKDFTWEPPSTD